MSEDWEHPVRPCTSRQEVFMREVDAEEVEKVVNKLYAAGWYEVLYDRVTTEEYVPTSKYLINAVRNRCLCSS
jgi:hypothetical protein